MKFLGNPELTYRRKFDMVLETVSKFQILTQKANKKIIDPIFFHIQGRFTHARQKMYCKHSLNSQEI